MLLQCVPSYNNTDLTPEDLCFTCRTEEETELNLGTSFSAETNRRDEDADMYVYFKLCEMHTYTISLSLALLDERLIPVTTSTRAPIS